MNLINRKTVLSRMIFLCCLNVTLFACLPCSSYALREPDAGKRPLPDYDIRSPYKNGIPNADVKWMKLPAQQAALEAIIKKDSNTSVRWSELNRAPSRIHNKGVPLTTPRGGDKKEIAAAYLNDNLPLFNLDADDIAELRTTRNFKTPRNGVTHVTLQQQMNGLDVFGATFMANLDKDGQIINVSSALIPKIRQNTRATPTLTPDDAIAKAAVNVGVPVPLAQQVVRQVYFPLTLGKTTLAYEVVINDNKTPNSYRIIVDAANGTVLWRHSLVAYVSPGGPVFVRESPRPNVPIGSVTAEEQRVDQAFNGLTFFPAADPHADWWNGSEEPNQTRTISNNVQVKDPADNYATAPSGVYFNFALPFPIDITADPASYVNASIVNTFYRMNRLHDQLYDWGFDEAAGNYQHDRFGGPAGDDRINVHVQKLGGDFCNAHSGGGWINTGMCAAAETDCSSTTGPWNCLDFGFETQVIAHEYGHSIHFNLIPSLTGAQYTGEGYCDIFALTTFAEAGDDLYAGYPIAQWGFNRPNGIRRAPYSTDQTIYPYTYGTISTAPGIYEVGEIWANTVWIAYANLVWKYGYQTGHPTMMKLVVDGMKLAPEKPDFLDLRDAILSADQINNGGVNACILWDAFAKMGLGVYAKSTGFDDGAPLESFATPSGCTPNIKANSSSLDLGPVCPNCSKSGQLELFNTGTGNLIVKKVSRISGSTDITVEPNPTLPVFIGSDAHVDFTVSCTSTASGAKSAVIRVESNDADQPSFDFTATCEGMVPVIVPVIANAGNFGEVCVGSFVDLGLTVNNGGSCKLSINPIVSSVPEFKVPTALPYPLVVEAGGSTLVPLRFEPSTFGPFTANITLTSDDPVDPGKIVTVTGSAPTGDIKVTGATAFGDVCAEMLAEKTISVCNMGKCGLDVTSASLGSCADFAIVKNPFPASVAAGSCPDLTIRFTPTSIGPKACTLTIASNDPDTPYVTLSVTANTPTPSIDVSPDLAFPATVIQSVGACTSPRPFPISNKGICNLTVTSVVAGPAGAYSSAALPSLPIILQPGHVVGDGAYKAVFAPTVRDRDIEGTLEVTYISDPIIGTTTTLNRRLCGEGVNSGARVLVSKGGTPLTTIVDQLKITRINGNRNKKIVDTVEVLKNLELTTVNPAATCPLFQYHREYGTVSNPIQLLPGSYQVTATATINDKKMTKTVAFDITTCTFNPTVIIDF